MEFWKILLIGGIITAVTRIVIDILYKHPHIYNKNICVRIVTQSLIIISMVTVGGIIGGKLLSLFLTKEHMIIIIILSIILSCLIFVIWSLGLGLDRFEDSIIQALYLITVIISIVCCTVKFSDYKINQKISTTYMEETTSQLKNSNNIQNS